jgi:hypothetical protein
MIFHHGRLLTYHRANKYAENYHPVARSKAMLILSGSEGLSKDNSAEKHGLGTSHWVIIFSVLVRPMT